MDNSSSKWSALVAVTLLVAITAIAITALIRYSVDDAKKILDWMGPLIGVVTGAFVGYFFTRGQVETANQLARTSSDQAQQSQTAAAQAREDANEAHKRSETLTQAVGRVMAGLEPAAARSLLEDPVVKNAFIPP